MAFSVADPGFPTLGWGGGDQKGLRQPIIVAIYFYSKLHDIEKQLDREEGRVPVVDPAAEGEGAKRETRASPPTG